ncbi:hypothetical protein M2451_000278 [Dysgonomonas sp. PFB1-18]|uniref:hypothetical protein n=1 Tax=unclassified Dysgonomonas TaxID=2630389 RepID=UPI002474EE47|nr:MULTISPECIES: hypothetical protein [unclassified Dysgonomonas]MDH6307829.1 hypothetical protein [Dysgonomonas sp. PF1-14]MDH6337747.1 hypothetical protein [Dysgonomonas sp. PF1-16]MDH6378971.1 hypothetical protein [Dysgonomonas sp. PFB1-18]MDH6396606.1 hypothetical protein [Dysgonomonas sp. PF1-23]
MKKIVVVAISLLLFLSCSDGKKGKQEKGTANEAIEKITAGFDLHKELAVDLMMDIPSSIYMKEGEGQYSILYIPKTEEVLEKYKNFDQKNNITISADSTGNLFYSDEMSRKTDEIIRSSLNIKDFCIIGRFIPSQYLKIDHTSTKGEYSISMPYEMQIYKLIGNEWQLANQVVISDFSGYDHYESIKTYRDLLGIGKGESGN